MFCKNCGIQLPDNALFCSSCGTGTSTADNKNTLSSAQNMPEAAPPFSQVNYTQQAPKQKNSISADTSKKKRTVIIAAAAAAVILLAVLIPILISAGRQNRYDDARALMDSGSYEEAMLEFDKLGSNYQDASALGETCNKEIRLRDAQALMEQGKYSEALPALNELGDFSSAASDAKYCRDELEYISANALFASGEYENAMGIFAGITGHKDAAAKEQECFNEIAYIAATMLLEQEEYTAAASAFAEIGDYKDAPSMGIFCSYTQVYLDAEAYISAGNYEAAKEILQPLKDDDFPGAQQLHLLCSNTLDYQAAMEHYDKGEFFRAMTAFEDLGSFEDSAAMATKCPQDFPKSSELYRNSSFSKKSVKIIIKNERDSALCLKYYTTEGELVSTIFIRPREKTTIHLPSGVYQLRDGQGQVWYGEADTFGASGYYSILKSDSSDTLFHYSSDYYYTLTCGVSDGNISSGNLGGYGNF